MNKQVFLSTGVIFACNITVRQLRLKRKNCIFIRFTWKIYIHILKYTTARNFTLFLIILFSYKIHNICMGSESQWRNHAHMHKSSIVWT